MHLAASGVSAKSPRRLASGLPNICLRRNPNKNKLSIVIENMKHDTIFATMNLEEAKEKFVQSWGSLGTSWGINRTMAQIHSLLLITKKPLCAEDIMAGLQISRGNANMNLRALIDWGLVRRELKAGERKEFFVAEKDIWEVARRVTAERKKRELEPILRVLDEVSQVKGPKDDEELLEFKETITRIQDFVGKLDAVTEKMTKSDRNWFFKAVMKLMG